jgi:hypothetical protein
MLLAGKPLVHVPPFIEQSLFAAATDRLGASITVNSWYNAAGTNRVDMSLFGGHELFAVANCNFAAEQIAERLRLARLYCTCGSLFDDFYYRTGFLSYFGGDRSWFLILDGAFWKAPLEFFVGRTTYLICSSIWGCISGFLAGRSIRFRFKNGAPVRRPFRWFFAVLRRGVRRRTFSRPILSRFQCEFASYGD